MLTLPGSKKLFGKNKTKDGNPTSLLVEQVRPLSLRHNDSVFFFYIIIF